MDSFSNSKSINYFSQCLVTLWPQLRNFSIWPRNFFQNRKYKNFFFLFSLSSSVLTSGFVFCCCTLCKYYSTFKLSEISIIFIANNIFYIENSIIEEKWKWNFFSRFTFMFFFLKNFLLQLSLSRKVCTRISWSQ